MRTITIQSSTVEIVLDNDSAQNLLLHIRRDGGEHRSAAEAPLIASINSQGQQPVRWDEDGKHGALQAVNEWLLAEGADDMGERIMDLRYELMRDLGLPPFDQDTPPAA